MSYFQIPSGVIFDFAGTVAPQGWLLCSGQAVSRSTYAALFSTIGETYGAGNGTTTFNLPDSRGRVSAGLDNMGGTAANRITAAGSGITGTNLGAAGGVEAITLASAQSGQASSTVTSTGQSQAHTHVFSGVWLPGAGGNTVSGGGAWSINNGLVTQSGNVDHSHNVSLPGAAAASPHSSTQPTIMFNKIIKI